ncbi:MAG TPA: hypothetical protein DHN29_08820 [Cytophagales bacterium]|nr:hypothetical protein [Cytophagales bacterium]
MKTIKYFHLIVILMFAFSCEEKDTPTPEEPEIIEIDIADFTATVKENSAQGALIGTVYANYEQGRLSFDLVSQSPEGAIQLDDFTGDITILDSALFDFETNTTVTAIFSATYENVSEQANITISISDLDEIVIDAADFSSSVDENSPNGTVLGTVSASSEQGAVTFSMVSQSQEGAISINTETGELTIAEETYFDFETNTSITAVFSATLGDVTEEANITISIIDVDETTLDPIDLSKYVYVGVNSAFNPLASIDVGNDSYVSTADIDGDGDLDVISGALDGTFYYFRNDDGTFIAQTGTDNPFDGLNVGSDSRHEFADIDNDGDLDLISGSGGGAIYYYENNDGVYSTPEGTHILSSFSHATLDSKPTFYDYDEDGDLDMLVGYFNTIELWINQGDSFMRANSNPFGSALDGTHQFPKFVDINSDGEMDLVAGRLVGDFRLLQKIAGGNYSISEHAIFEGLNVGNYSTPAFIALNGDGKLEMLSGSSTGMIKLFELTEK